MTAPFSVAFPSNQPGLDVFDLWAPAAGPISQPGEIGEVWRADLPGDPLEAARLLETRAELVRRSQRAIPLAQLALEVDLRAVPPAGGELSFSIAGAADSPRGILAAGLYFQVQARAQSRGKAEPASFGLFDGLQVGKPELEEAAETVRRFSEQVHRSVNQLGLVETLSGGQKAAVTRAGWSGDIQTWWTAGAGPEQRLQHQQVLAQALATRQAWLRLLCLVTGGVTRVAASLAAGPFSPIAIWTTWNYVREVIRQVQAIRVQIGPPPAA